MHQSLVPAESIWTWKRPDTPSLQVAWQAHGDLPERVGQEQVPAMLLIHGFGASGNHWRHNLPVLGDHTRTYALDLIGFGASSQPQALLPGEQPASDQANGHTALAYSFDLWGTQVADFCKGVVEGPVLLVGNSIGGVVALRAAQLLEHQCKGVVLIDCAQRLMDDKQLATQPAWMAWIRPLLKTLVSQRWLSTALFRNAARPRVIKSVLKQAYPSGNNIDDQLVELLYKPTQRPGAAEAFRGFINLFDDYLAPQLMHEMNIPIDLIWGELDPWEPLPEAKKWVNEIPCVRSLHVIHGAGHCPHDEVPDCVNSILLRLFQHFLSSGSL